MNRRFPPLLAALLALALTDAGHAEAAGARLAVLVIVDQLPASELDRIAPLFGKKGFGGLDRVAARHVAVYGYACTLTAPGHATLSTGTYPEIHGIPGNAWYEGRTKVRAGADPAQLSASTLGDALKQHTGGAGRVVAISLKKRAAVLSAGPSADLTVWYDAETGRYRADKAGALSDELAGAAQRSLTTGTWSVRKLPAERGYPWAIAGGIEPRLPRGFPNGGGTYDLSTMPDRKLARSGYRATPQAVHDQFEIARALIEKYELGADAVPDYLVVSISATDYVGHAFGPKSPESVDVLVRTSDAIARFRSGLPRGTVFAVTSDHGVGPVPERNPPGMIGGRVVFEDLIERAGKGPHGRPLLFAVRKEHAHVDLEGLKPEQARAAIASARKSIESHPGVVATYLPSPEPGEVEDGYAELMRRCVFPGRHGDILIRQRDGWIWDGRDRHHYVGIHGSPYAYDQQVPLLLTGPGVTPGTYPEPVDTRDVAPSLAALLGVPPPAAAQGAPVSSVAAVARVR